MSIFGYRVSLVFLLWILLLPQFVQANAYCALRDPTAALRGLYPHSSSFRSSVKVVDNNIRTQISEVLPFGLHHNELGEHTLYISLNESDPVGMVHMRSEVTRWGLIEIAWSLDFDLKIRDLFIQRCRSSVCRGEGIENIKKLLVGKSFKQIRNLLNDSGSSLVRNQMTASLTDEAITLPIVRSALKTILVTELVWHQELESMRIGATAQVELQKDG